MVDLWQFLSAVLQEWIALVTGGLIMAAIFVLTTIFNWKIRRWVYIALVAWVFLFVACFEAWKKERRAAVDAQAHAAAVTAERDKVFNDVQQCRVGSDERQRQINALRTGIRGDIPIAEVQDITDDNQHFITKGRWPGTGHTTPCEVLVETESLETYAHIGTVALRVLAIQPYGVERSLITVNKAVPRNVRYTEIRDKPQE